MAKTLPAHKGDTGDMGLIPGLGKALRGKNGNPPSLLAWRISWTEEPGGSQSVESHGIRRG